MHRPAGRHTGAAEDRRVDCDDPQVRAADQGPLLPKRYRSIPAARPRRWRLVLRALCAPGGWDLDAGPDLRGGPWARPRIDPDSTGADLRQSGADGARSTGG